MGKSESRHLWHVGVCRTGVCGTLAQPILDRRVALVTYAQQPPAHLLADAAAYPFHFRIAAIQARYFDLVRTRTIRTRTGLMGKYPAMILNSLSVEGFLGQERSLVIEFNSDINIVTGYNGAGKTNLLKLLWYTISGNIHTLLEEVEFVTLTLETSEYSLSIRKISFNTCTGWIDLPGHNRQEFRDIFDDERSIHVDARDSIAEAVREIGGSLFFPTFRRIEGGFTISSPEKRRGIQTGLLGLARPSSDLQKSLLDIAQRLTNSDHTFVTSISTIDIADLLLRRYTAMSEASSSLQTKMTQEIIEEIRKFRWSHVNDASFDSEDAGKVLDEIAKNIEVTDVKRERAMAPLRAVQELVAKIFRHKAIQLNQRVSFGDAASAISSDLLSAGEKQMLSFICYNAFFSKIPIFIDEPELSLHVDWQRTLFPTLESQGKDNQFIIATHSPFIYGKYPEKEIMLVDNRGAEGHD